MKILRLLVSCYPPEFRERFGPEMLETLAAASEAGWRREAVGLLRGLSAAWLAEIDWAPRLAGMMAALALHLAGYAVLVPISGR